MKIFLDTSHLIRVVEKSDPVSVSALEVALRDGGHQLVLSFATVNELAAPLLHSRTSTNVMRLLNVLEALPLTYVADIRIDRLELEAAIQAWRQSLEPTRIEPFTDRLDRVLAIDGSMFPLPPDGESLSAIVFAMWQLGIIGDIGTSCRDFSPQFKPTEKQACQTVSNISSPLSNAISAYTAFRSRGWTFPTLVTGWRRIGVELQLHTSRTNFFASS